MRDPDPSSEVRETGPTGRKGSPRSVGELFAVQDLVASIAQLETVGLSEDALRKRVKRGELYRIHRGVYSPVPRTHLRPRGRWRAAVLASGAGAVLSHRSAAALHELRATGRRNVDVTARSGGGRKHPGIDAHRSRTLAAQDVTDTNGIPVTSIARTLLDYAAVESARNLEKAVEQALVLEVYDHGAVLDVLERNRGHRGVHRLRRVIHRLAPDAATQTDSPLEEPFLMLCRRYGIRDPQTQQYLPLPGGEVWRVDFMWRRERVIVELDGYGTHRTRLAFQRDRRRDALATAMGWRPLRFTHDDVHLTHARTALTLTTVLAREAA